MKEMISDLRVKIIFRTSRVGEYIMQWSGQLAAGLTDLAEENVARQVAQSNDHSRDRFASVTLSLPDK